jgi:sugar/nucleoside kinase (ribokinase family)
MSPIDQKDVVDTTGAGDAFIGSVCYAIAAGLPMGQVRNAKELGDPQPAYMKLLTECSLNVP